MYSRSPFPATATSSQGPSLLSSAFNGPSSSNAPLNGAGSSFDRWNMTRPPFGAPLSATISDPAAFGVDRRPAPAIVIRRLPLNISNEALGSMLIFAADLLETEIIPSPYREDRGFTTAVARFQTHAGALEAQSKLHGKPNATKEANMIVEIHSGNMAGPFDRRSISDIAVSRTQTSSASSAASSGGQATAVAVGGRSRFGSTFQSSEKTSPPLPTPSSSGGASVGSSGAELPIPDANSHLQNLFSPQSPVANGVGDVRRVSGKSMINDDLGDDETGELLKDPIGYARNGQQNRRPTNPQIPIGRFNNLSLCTDHGSNGASALRSPTTTGSVASPHGSQFPLQSPTSPTAFNGGLYSPGAFPRPQYPPINPADQNPPCNTLYVGNLPVDTSEDELKAIFSKQRGYRRLCFRTKQNGPMCFVEFEDISFATKALNELYGHPLHNSVKGGIRLSFSKNPLGVRSGQHPAALNGLPGASGGMSGVHGMVNPHNIGSNYNNANGSSNLNGAANGGAGVLNPTANFSSVSGPPPGLGTPPGIMNAGGRYQRAGTSASAGGDDSFFGLPAMKFQDAANMASQRNLHNFPFSAQHQSSFHSNNNTSHQAQQQVMSGGVPPSMNGSFGREGRGIGGAGAASINMGAIGSIGASTGSANVTPPSGSNEFLIGR